MDADISVTLRGAEEEVAEATVVEKVALGKRKREEEVVNEEESSEDSTSESESENESEDESEGEGESEEDEEDEEDDMTMQESEEKEIDTSNPDDASSSASTSETDSDSNSESEEENDSDSDSDSESETSSSSSESVASDSGTSSTSSTSSSSSDDPATLERPTARLSKVAVSKPAIPPGQGTSRTHLRNRRKMRVKELKRLIAEGTLRKGSTLADLDLYENGGTSNYFSPQNEVETSEAPEVVAEEENKEEEEEKEREIKLEEKGPGKSPPRRVDVAAVSRFIKAGLVGNEGYDRARQEARLRGMDKKITPSDFEIVRERPLVPRKVAAKKQKTTDTPIPDIRELELKEPEQQEVEGEDEDMEETDPLVAGFYEQIELAAQARQSRAGTTSSTSVNPANARTKTAEKKGWPENVVLKAFECEPEWCGMVEAEEGQEVDSIEIDPPSLPFIDNYSRAKHSKLTTNPPPITPSSTTFLPLQPSAGLPLSEPEILALPKVESPVVGTQIFFKSLFLHPQRFEPTILWRLGRVTGTQDQALRIKILAPIVKDEDEDEEGEMIGGG